jgi:threonine dehydrogenase-like Zn-dependent dehydrogenase
MEMIYETGNNDKTRRYTHRIPFSRYEQAYKLIKKEGDKAMKVMIYMAQK